MAISHKSEAGYLSWRACRDIDKSEMINFLLSILSTSIRNFHKWHELPHCKTFEILFGRCCNHTLDIVINACSAYEVILRA